MEYGQCEGASESRDLDVGDIDRTVIVDEDGDIVDIYTVDGKTWIGTRVAGSEDGFAVHVNEQNAKIIIGALMRRVLNKEMA